MITIVDYGAGNLRSILRAIESHDVTAEISADPDRIAAADRIVLPGVGNAKAAMEKLNSTGLASAVTEQVQRGTPLLGVCLGMQLLFGDQEEGPTTGLGLLEGRAVRLPESLKIPHMGWNTVTFTDHSPLAGQSPAAFYFVHSYQVEPASADMIAGETDYGHRFCSMVIHENIWGTQFHPEKSQNAGLALIGAWINN